MQPSARDKYTADENDRKDSDNALVVADSSPAAVSAAEEYVDWNWLKALMEWRE